MPTIPTGQMERELRKLYLRWLSGVSVESDDLTGAIDRFQRDSQELIESMGGRTAALGALADFPVPKRLDLSPVAGVVYNGMQQAAIQAGLMTGLNSVDVARAMFRQGMDKSFNRLKRLARTETTNAYWKNAFDSIADLPALVMVWGAERGPRTCPWCLERDGLVMDSPNLRDHPNGRCTPIPMLRSQVKYRGSIDSSGRIYKDPAWTDQRVKGTRGTPMPAPKTYSPEVQQEARLTYVRSDSFFEARDAYKKGETYELSTGENLFEVLDSMIENEVVTEQHLYRAMRVSEEWLEQLSEGSTLEHQFYVSTTSDLRQARAYGAQSSSGPEVVLDILNTNGTAGTAGMKELSEYVLPPSTRFEVVKVHPPAPEAYIGDEGFMSGKIRVEVRIR
jgi:hypothetical protein